MTAQHGLGGPLARAKILTASKDKLCTPGCHRPPGFRNQLTVKQPEFGDPRRPQSAQPTLPPADAFRCSTQHQTYHASHWSRSPLAAAAGHSAEPTFFSAGSQSTAGVRFQSRPRSGCTHLKGPASCPDAVAMVTRLGF